MGKRHISTIALIIIIFAACVPESKKVLTEVDVSASDPIFNRIHDFEFSKNTDSLLQYISHENPNYRFLVANAFSSHHDKNALDSLFKLLNDPAVKVRSSAAYALGQINDPNAEDMLLAGFRQKDTMSVDNEVNALILESLGKLGDTNLADFMISAKGYRDTDTLLLQGRMKALYRFALRDYTSPKITELAVRTVRNKRIDNETRLYAAHYLARSKNLDIDKVKFQIAEAFVDETNINIKMALALALRHTSDKEIQTSLLDQLELQIDYRVKVNIIRALVNYPYIDSAEKITELLKSDNIHVAMAATEFISKNGNKDDILYYRQIAKDSIPWQVKASLYKAINKLLPYYYTKTINATQWHIQNLIKAESDTLKIAHYIRSMSHDPGSYPFIINFVEELDNELLQTVAAETLGQILADENFNGTFQGYIRYHRRQIMEFLFDNYLYSDNEGAVAEVANAIANEDTYLYELIDSSEFIQDIKSNFNNPGQIETIHALDRALSKLRGVNRVNLTKVADPLLPDWEKAKAFTQNTKVIIKTNKGAFTAELYMDEAPGSVINFLKLVEANFYDDKIFHRVVPNFVIQTGSPRQDNYGGKDYVISSELAPLYYNDEGYLGMASAGLNTESTQWFVTHSPTPHLDGKYTIFGKITEGMDVIHNIQVGDIIQDIIISNL